MSKDEIKFKKNLEACGRLFEISEQLFPEFETDFILQRAAEIEWEHRTAKKVFTRYKKMIEKGDYSASIFDMLQEAGIS